MENKIKRWKRSRNILKLVQYRESNLEVAHLLKRQSQFNDSLIRRLGLEVELEGHQGCVNCLEWSPDGMCLASGSDDTNVILWDPFRHKLLKIIPTPHIGNIFSVKFLAKDHLIATAAGDCRVVVQNIAGRRFPLLDCACHIGRVKRLATSPDQPTLFWSAGEDGLVVQYDLREPHECPTQSKVLIDLSFKSEIKCIAVNPTKPHYIAVGANDCFVRLYDRRMIKISEALSFTPSKRMQPQPLNPECVQYYSPGHLAKESTSFINVKLAVTYVAFNSAGSEMLVNVGGEQIYLFDVNNTRHINEVKIPQFASKKPKPVYKSCCRQDFSISDVGSGKSTSNSDDECACFYLSRALKCYQRKWMSDLYGAARDYLHIIQNWPDQKQAYVGLIKCLIALKWEEEANAWLQHFLKIHPDHGIHSQVQFLMDELHSLKFCCMETDDEGAKKVDNDEKQLRLDSIDYERRFVGHCNTTTDIKEANFLGHNDDYICAGSDEGIIFIWDKHNMEIVRALFGDTSIVNCVQPHPSACFIASSGIDNAVKIWSPRPEDGKLNNRIVKGVSVVVETNQQRLSMDPFESMLASMGFMVPHPSANSHHLGEHSVEGVTDVHACRTS